MDPCYRVKVVQCWDDGVDDDVRLTEILRRYGAKATFNICPATHSRQRTTGWKFKDIKPVWKLALPELTKVYSGFTVANHSANHLHMTRVHPEVARFEIFEGKDRLEQLVGYEVKGFAYPFGEFNDTVAALVREAGHAYGRTIERSSQVVPCPDLMTLAPSCHFLDSDFWLRFEAAKSQGTPFYFWGHSFELVTESDWLDFESVIARLGRDPDVIWADVLDLCV